MEPETFLTVRQAAEACRVSIDTIRRRLRAGNIDGAERTGPNDWDGWLLPVSGLRSAGLEPELARRVEADAAVIALRAERAELLARLEGERARSDALSALVERQDREIARLERILEAVLPGRAA